jgi:hypothetical protein
LQPGATGPKDGCGELAAGAIGAYQDRIEGSFGGASNVGRLVRSGAGRLELADFIAANHLAAKDFQAEFG